MTKATTERQLSPHELGFQDLDSPGRLQIVSGLAMLADDVKIETVSARLDKFVEANPQFRCRITGDKSLEWKVDADFDLANHCLEIGIDADSTDDVLSFVSTTASNGLPDEHPPWRVALLRITGESTEPERCALAIWAHHSLLDGLQGMELYSSLLDNRMRSAKLETPEHVADSTGELKTRVVSASCVRAMASELMRRPPSGPFSSQLASTDRRTLSFEWSRKSFQTVRRQLNASFQEVLLAVMTDALARYSTRHGHARDVRAILPLGRSDNNSSTFTTNRHDVGFVDLPITRSAADRVDAIRRSLGNIRDEQKKGIFNSILGFMGCLPNMLRKAFAHRYARQADLLVTLIPGGPSKSTIDGVEVTALFAQPALPPRHAVAIGVTVTRRNVCVTVQVDPGVIADPEVLRSYFEQASCRLLANKLAAVETQTNHGWLPETQPSGDTDAKLIDRIHFGGEGSAV